MPAPLNLSGEIFRGFKLCELLGYGCFGAVYRAECGEEHIAIKVSNPSEDFYNEVRILQNLIYTKSVAPKFLFDLEIGRRCILAMELTGPNLWILLRATGVGAFTLKIWLQIANQTVIALEALHKHRVLHRDLKLDNMVVTVPNEKSEVSILIIDYGHSWIYQDANGKPINDEKGLDFSMLKHCSPAVSIGAEPGTKDDVVQLLYALIHAAGFDVYTMLAQPARQLLAWKKQLLRDPKSILTGAFAMMAPLVTEVSKLVEGSEPDYSELLVAIRDMVYDSDPSAPLRLVSEDGVLQLQ